jgi:hypothetical protein
MVCDGFSCATPTGPRSNPRRSPAASPRGARAEPGRARLQGRDHGRIAWPDRARAIQPSVGNGPSDRQSARRDDGGAERQDRAGVLKAGSGFDTVIARAAFGLPVALLAAYVNNLATTHRREAWRLRHIELQIRTANPFLGLLDGERRKETLAALALRFFPGQEGVGSDSNETDLPLNLIEAVGKLLREQQPQTVVAPAVTPRSE